MPILVSTITTIVVFFPVLFLTGVARNLFIPLALTISFSLIDELLRVAHGDAAPVPVLAARGPRRRANAWSGWLIRDASSALDDAYARPSAVVLRHRAADHAR
jgi:multidrug efflux pump subunit AcrB